MKRNILPILLPFLALPVSADTFGSGTRPINIAFVDIGNAGNVADNTGFGAVAPAKGRAVSHPGALPYW
jgi:hypothetical protein